MILIILYSDYYQVGAPPNTLHIHINKNIFFIVVVVFRIVRILIFDPPSLILHISPKRRIFHSLQDLPRLTPLWSAPPRSR